MDGIRSFIAVDSRSAVDVGGLLRGTRSIHVKKPQCSGAFPGAEEVGMQRSILRLSDGDRR